MATNNNLSDLLTSIANAIRSKKGTTSQINAQNFASEIESIPTGGGTSVTNNYITMATASNRKLYYETIGTAIPTRTFGFPYDVGWNNGLKEIHLPNIETIGQQAFAFNTKLDTIYLPNVKYIQGGNSFQGCTAIALIDLPSIASISASSFTGCTALTSVTIGTNASTTLCTLTDSNAFSSTPIATSETSGFIYVADSLVEQYKTATNWITYASKIKGISEKGV